MGKKEKKQCYAIALSMVENLGSATYKKLTDHFGTAQQVFENPPKVFKSSTKTASKLTKQLTQQKEHLLQQASTILTKHQKNGIVMTSYEDPNYPERLRHIHNPPPLLYMNNAVDLNKQRMIAIVGTRNATNYGKRFVEQLIAELRAYQVTIVSGLAYGVDICAHKAALANEIPTISVMAGGLDVIYPSEHAKEAMAISKNGCLISEHPLGVKPEKHYFPARNRIIAGLVDAVIVVEAGEKSGTFITAQYGNEFGKEVFAVPGNIENPYSRGCHYLIKTHQANILTCTKDLAYMMNWDTKTNPQKQLPNAVRIPLNALNEEEKRVVNALHTRESLHLDELSTRTNMTLTKLSLLTMQLEMKKLIYGLPGDTYRLCA